MNRKKCYPTLLCIHLGNRWSIFHFSKSDRLNKNYFQSKSNQVHSLAKLIRLNHMFLVLSPLLNRDTFTINSTKGPFLSNDPCSWPLIKPVPMIAQLKSFISLFKSLYEHGVHRFKYFNANHSLSKVSSEQI